MRAMFAELVSFCSTPSNVLALLVIGGIVINLLRRRWTTMIAAVALGAVAVAMLSPLGTALLTPLEERFPDAKFPNDAIDGIIVLGGSYDAQIHSYLSTILLEEDTEPMAAIPDLARHYPQALIIFSGGTDPSDPKVSEAAIVKRYFISFGIDPNRIVIEDKSLTTSENARFHGAAYSSESRSALVIGLVGVSSSARHRRLPQGGVQYQRFFRRSAHPRMGQSMAAGEFCDRQSAPHRCGCSRMGWFGLV